MAKYPIWCCPKKARQLEAEDCPPTTATSKGARDDPQIQCVIQTLQEIKAQIQHGEDLAPNPKKWWRGRYGCYYCGEPGHWRKTCPTRFQRKRKKPPDPWGSSTPPEDNEDESTSMEEESEPTPTEGQNVRNAKRSKLCTKPQYYNPDPVARMFGRANEATVEVNGVSTTCLVDTGAIVTIVNAEFCDHLGLAVHSIDGLISVSVTGGTNISYLGYTVATIEFPHIPNY